MLVEQRLAARRRQFCEQILVQSVDGLIDQDTLGLDRVYVQAKRYATGNNVTPELTVIVEQKTSRVIVYTFDTGTMPSIVVVPSNVTAPSEPSPKTKEAGIIVRNCATVKSVVFAVMLKLFPLIDNADEVNEVLPAPVPLIPDQPD